MEDEEARKCKIATLIDVRFHDVLKYKAKALCLQAMTCARTNSFVDSPTFLYDSVDGDSRQCSARV